MAAIDRHEATVAQVTNVVGFLVATLQIPADTESRLVARNFLCRLEQDGIRTLAEADQKYFGARRRLLQCRREKE